MNQFARRDFTIKNTAESMSYLFAVRKRIANTVVKKVRKGVWRMPRLTEAMKDVISCDKLRVGANNP